MAKRGMVSPVFKYIMALFVGVIFLVFFINFGVQYMKGQKSLDAVKITSGFDDILSTLGASEDAEDHFQLGIPITFLISPDPGNNRFNIRTEGSPRGLRSYNILFTPEKVSGKVLHILTKRWNFPFAVTNFFYLTDNTHRYFIIYSDETEDLAMDIAGPEDMVTPEISSKFGVILLPKDRAVKDYQKVAASLSSIKPVFIFLEEMPSLENSFESIEGAKVRVLTASDEDSEYGTILFEDGQRESYLGMPMLVGAIFSEDSSAYSYSFNMALNKLSIVTKIYSEKLSILASKPNFFGCTEYSLIKQNFETLVSLARSQETNPGQYIRLIESLENNNDLLGGDCPEIF